MCGSLRVLVVDGREDFRVLLALFLSKDGFRVRCAGDAVTARRLLRKERIDLVVVSATLPDGRGASVAAHAARRGAGAVMISGLLPAHDGPDARPQRSVRKPVRPGALPEKIRTALRQDFSVQAVP